MDASGYAMILKLAEPFAGQRAGINLARASWVTFWLSCVSVRSATADKDDALSTGTGSDFGSVFEFLPVSDPV